MKPGPHSDRAIARRSWARKRLHPLAFAGCLTLAIAGAGVGVALASGNTATSRAAAARVARQHRMHGAGNKAGIFTDRCTYSHSANDDPILMPGQPGASMLHDFFGNSTTNASSTAAKLIGGATTCATAADASGYWTPALYDNGQRVMPVGILNYWLGASRTGPTAPLPPGLQMIAGNEQGTSPQPTDRLSWNCHASTGPGATRNGPKRAAPYGCPAGQELRLTIRFPSCWDGHTLSAVGQDNVVYPLGSRCPASHPIGLSRAIVHVFYPSRLAGKFTVSMGPGMQGSIYSEHADFLSGWKTSVFDRLTSTCLDTHFRCRAVTGPNGTPRDQPSGTVPANS